MMNLAYTIAFDPPDCSGHRALAKMLVSSLLRTCFDGDIVVFRNTEAPLFMVERKGVHEVYIQTDDLHFDERARDSWTWKYKVRDFIDPAPYETVIFLDVDSLALRNVDHLLEGDWDIGYQPERERNIDLIQFNCFLTDEELAKFGSKRRGVNSGTIAVRASLYHEVMAEWEQIDTGPTQRERCCSDQGSWNRLLLDTDLKTVPFERGEVAFPLYLHKNYKEYKDAALLHMLGGNIVEKVHFTFGMYMGTFYCDPTALFLHFLET